MLADQARQLLAQGEGLMVEFKSVESGKLGSPVFETVAAFSNRYGGHILMGVADDGTVLGIPANQIDNLKRNFAKMLNNPEVMLPTLYLEPETIEIDDKLILAVYVPSHESPVQYKMHTFDRAEDGDIDISRNRSLLNALFERKSSFRTERKLCPLVKASDLRLAELIPRVRTRAVLKREGHPWGKMVDDLDILHSAGLIETDPATGKECFNLAAVLLFGTEETIKLCCPGYFIDCVKRVVDLDRYDDRLMVRCNLIEAFDQIMGFIAKHTDDRFFIVDGQRTGVRDRIAFEVVSNILSHQEFSSTMPAHVTIEADRLVTENWNRALRSGPINPDNFMPDPKNPRIAEFFVNIGFADTLGSGVRNLYKYTRIYSGQDPQLIDGDVFTTIIPLTRSMPSDGIEDGIEMAQKLSASERAILDALRLDGTLTIKALMAGTGLSQRQVSRVLAGLRDRGLLRREGSDRSGSWVVLK